MIGVIFLATGCGSIGTGFWDNKDQANLAIFVESASRDPQVTFPIEWFRSNPQEAYVERKPLMLPLPLLKEVRLLPTPDGGKVAELQFTERGALSLESMTIEQLGHRLFFLAWNRPSSDAKKNTARCIGVQSIMEVNRLGRIYFTPDMPENEAEQLVADLNRALKAAQR